MEKTSISTKKQEGNFVTLFGMIQNRPPRLIANPDGSLLVTVYDIYLGAEIELESDLVVLSTPLVPA